MVKAKVDVTTLNKKLYEKEVKRLEARKERLEEKINNNNDILEKQKLDLKTLSEQLEALIALKASYSS